MKKLLFILFMLVGYSVSAQHNFLFTYYEVYKSKTYDSVSMWSGLKRSASYQNEGTIYINKKHFSFRITLKEDSKFVEQKGILRFGENSYTLSDDWHAIFGTDATTGNYMAVYKNGMWVVYYRKKPQAVASRESR